VTHHRQLVHLILVGSVLLLTACTRLPLDTTPSRPGLAAIVTWNMNAGVGNLQRLLADLDRGLLTSAPAADTVVLLQEALSEDAAQLRRVADARGWSVFLVPVRYDGHRTRSNAILSSRPLLLPHAIPLPQERQTRTAAAAFIDLAGERIFVVSAHLENRAGGWKVLFSDNARGRQAEALIQALPSEEPGIVGGDLNTWLGPREPAWLSLVRRFPDTPASRTPTFRDRLVLDHLFFDLPDGWRADTHVVADKYGSDHHPVVAVVSAT
jgi:endonuclease/exonuclease/phosphatase family metal-dependent hydrolase